MQIIIDREEGACVVGEHPTLPPCPAGPSSPLLAIVGVVIAVRVWRGDRVKLLAGTVAFVAFGILLTLLGQADLRDWIVAGVVYVVILAVGVWRRRKKE